MQTFILFRINNIKNVFFFVIIIFSFIGPAEISAQNIPPEPDQWVMDYANLLKENELTSLNNLLSSYEDSTSNQIVVAIFNDAQGYPIEEFTIKLAEAWQIGQKEKDNGIILAIFMQERKIRIEVGYGLEDMVPDAIALQIAQYVISSYFKDGNYYKGIFEGAVALTNAASGKFKNDIKQEKGGKNYKVLFILIFILLVIIISYLNRQSQITAGPRGWQRTGPFFWGGFGGGSGGGGGFSGGGFSAGGGSFGGGGATGSW